MSASSALVVLFLLGAIVLVALVAAIGRMAWILPVRASWRASIVRWAPVGGLGLGVAYLLWASAVVLKGHGLATTIAWLLVGVALLAISWTPLRDVISGVFWRAGRAWRLGQRISVDDLEGRIARLGYRVVVVETAQGERVLVPYGKLLRSSVRLSGDLRGAVPHVFTIPQSGSDIEQLREAVERSAWLCHGASLSQQPRLRMLDETDLEVTVFTLTPDFAPRVEAAVRRAVTAATAGSATAQSGASATDVAATRA